jgi:ferredoxin-NADP reductase
MDMQPAETTGRPSMGPWQLATVLQVRPETPTAKTFRLELPQPRPHLAGQHYVLRLTAPDGYRAQRSYSVATAPGLAYLELTVELLPGGEVSEFLHDVVVPGDKLEVRGPIGGYFAWDGHLPSLGVAGGSGVVPLMAMLRHARALGHPELMPLVVSARSPAELYYAAELPGPHTTLVYTRQPPPGFARPAGRLTREDLGVALDGERTVFVCGAPQFCDTATDLLQDIGVPAGRIRVERFGPSG